MNVNHFQNAPLASARPQVQQVPARPTLAQADVAMLPRAAIDSEGGVREGVSVPTKSLARRQLATPRAAQGAQRQGVRGRAAGEANRKQARPLERSDGEDEELHLDSVEQTLDMLRDDSSRRGRGEVDAILSERFTPIEQWRVLRDALVAVDDLNLSNYKKKVLRESISEMMADIVERDRSVRKALQESDVSGSLEAAVEGSAPKSARELRFLITEKGSVDKPLAPLTTLKAVIRHLGAEHAEKAIAMLCSQMLSGL
ncbi:hypothetical protein IP92_05478 [Pseudoduganella flava]|nr:hypothetical protein IP92_05478 [Pseudoduganella flava]